MKRFSRLAAIIAMAFILSAAAFAAAAPGLNLLTGTTEVQTFDNLDALPAFIINAELSSSPFEGEAGKALRHYNGESITSSYGTIGFAFNPALDRNRPYQISFKAYKWSSDDSVGTTNTQLWIMKNGTAGWQIAKHIGSFASGHNGWYEHDYNVSTFGSLTNSSTGALDTTDIDTIYFEWQYDSLSSYNSTEKIYIDDVSIIPSYKITYIDEDGSTIKTEYQVMTAKTFSPDVLPADKEKGIIGWSAKDDGTADAEIELKNQDFNLYAIYDNNLRINLEADKTLLTENGDVANLTTDLWHRNGVDGVTVSFSVAEGASFVTLKDNGDGTATVTAKAEGMAKIVCTASTGEKEEMYMLVDNMTITSVEKIQTVPTIKASEWLYDHTGATYDEAEGAWKVIKRTDVLKPDGVTLYNNGFLSKSGSVDTSVYKYLLFRVKADRSTSFQIRESIGGTWYSATYPTIAATNGAYVDVAVDICTPVNSATIGQWVLGVTNHHDAVYIKDITLSNISTYEPEIPEVKSVKILSKVSEIADDMGTASVHAAAFSSKSSNVKVSWKSSSDCIVIINDGNGKATLKAMSDGTATITAYTEGDETVSESFDVTVTGQREKQAVYDIRILFWGASTTKHPPAPSIGWNHDWGMAASAEENDYVHKLVSYLEEEFYPSKVTYEVIASSVWDQALSSATDASADWTTHAQYTEIETIMKDLRPNIIVTAMTGNMSASTGVDVAYNAYKQMYDMMYSYCPDAIVVAQHCGLSCVSRNDQMYALLDSDYSDKTFFVYHVNSTMKLDPANLAPEYAAIHSGVAAHWGDKGHDLVATTCFNYIAPEVPAHIEADYIFLPEDIEITGDTKVDEKGASLQLGINVTPNDASSDIVWSVDNSNIAVINKDGLLSPLSNGTVVVTAKCAYSELIYDTHTVTITNQLDNFTLTYAPGTTDTVTNLPAADEYAAGEYTLSTEIPLRDAYTFIGWGLTENATQAVTSVNMTKPTTVYALWKKTESFEFEGTYDESNGFVYGFAIESGFHNNVKNSNLYTTCTAGAKVTFKSPVVDIENKRAAAFALSSAYTDSASTVEFKIKTTGGEKTYIYPLTSTKQTVYVADISSLTGNITGFEIFVNAAPADNSMFEIGLDYVRFIPIRELDKASYEFVISDASMTVSSLAYDGYTGVTVSEESGAVIAATLDSGYTLNISGTSTLYVKASKGASLTTNSFVYENASYSESSVTVYTGTDDGLTQDTGFTRTLTSYDTASFRTKYPEGIRVKASVAKNFYTNELVSEYGFVVAKKENLTNGNIIDVVLDESYIASKYVVYGKAYSSTENIHKVFDSNDETEFFTAVLINVPKSKENFETMLVFRPYVKYGDSIIYGAKIEKTIYDVALSIYNDESVDADTLSAAREILEICGYFNDQIFIPADGLYD